MASLNLDKVYPFILDFGQDPISIACLQPGLSYYFTSFGCQAFKKIGKRAITLGPPICRKSDQLEMIRRFSCTNKDTIFCYLHNDTAQLCSEEGYFVSGMGVDRYVKKIDIRTRMNKPIQGALKHAYKANLQINEFDPAHITDREKNWVEQIQKEYLDSFFYKKEIIFLNSPLSLENEFGKRYFFIYSHDSCVPFGIIVLNPYHNAGKPQGYLLDIIRFKKCKIWGLWLSCVYELANMLEGEGLELCLGFCPMRDLSNKYDNSRILSWQVSTLGKRLGQASYPSRLYDIKHLVPGLDVDRFFASRSRNGLAVMSAFIRASGVKLPELVNAWRRT